MVGGGGEKEVEEREGGGEEKRRWREEKMWMGRMKWCRWWGKEVGGGEGVGEWGKEVTTR